METWRHKESHRIHLNTAANLSNIPGPRLRRVVTTDLLCEAYALVRREQCDYRPLPLRGRRVIRKFG